MRYLDRAIDPQHAQELLNALAEGYVLANMATIERSPDGFPCCCGCGDFELEATQVSQPVLALRQLAVQGPQSLTVSKKGNALELACFQCAQRRREGEDDAYVDVKVQPDGRLCCIVVRSQGDDEDMIKYAPQPERNCEDCGCSAEVG